MQNIGSWLPLSKSGLESRTDGLPILLVTFYHRTAGNGANFRTHTRTDGRTDGWTDKRGSRNSYLDVRLTRNTYFLEATGNANS